MLLLVKLHVTNVTFGQLQEKMNIDIDNTKEVFFSALISKNALILNSVKSNKLTWEYGDLASHLVAAFGGEKVATSELTYAENDIEKLYVFLIEGINIVNNEEENTLKAYQNFSKAIQISDRLDFNEGLKFSLINMLSLLGREFFLDKEKSVSYLKHLKELKSTQTDDLVISLVELNLKSKENTDLESVKENKRNLRKIDSLFKMISDEHALKAEYYYSKAIQAKLRKDLDESIFYMHKANSLFDVKFQREKLQTSIWQLSSIYYLKKQSDSALFYLNESRKLSNSYRDQFYDERLASWIYSSVKQYDSAYVYLERSVRSDIKSDAKKNSLQSGLLAVENETEKLKLDKLQLDNQRKTNQNYFITALAVLIIGTITAIFLQKNTTKQRKLAEQEALIEQQKVETLLREQELVSLDAMIAGQEKERTKVANELHDDLGSLMATVKLHFDNVKVDEKDPAMKSAQNLLEKAYQKIRGMAHAKNSGVMANQGLLPAVQKMARTINETSALEVSVEDFGLADRMENSLELTIFRILQELITNIIKHAQASKASIQFTQHEDKLNIIVEDNGSGFDMSTAKRNSSGMGLGTIEKRIEHLEGSFTVDSVLGKGTSILIDIPV